MRISFRTLTLMTLVFGSLIGMAGAQTRAGYPSRGHVPHPMTARNRIASDINPRALWDGRNSVDFHSLRFPKMVRAAEADFLIDEEYVLGITERGESRAYPTRFASWHHIINDRIGKKSEGGATYVTISYCIVCNSGIRFETPMIDSRPLTFDFYGLYNGVMTMVDRDTQSVWLQVSGRAVKGPMMDRKLKRGALLDTTWGQWKRLHPDTLVMAPDPQSAADYEPKGSVMMRGYDAFPADYFRPTVTHRDTRLPMFESVLAVSLPEAESRVLPIAVSSPARNSQKLARAYRVKTFRGKTGVLNDTLGREPLAVLFLAPSETMMAVSRVIDGRALTLEVRNTAQGKPAFYDRETGTRWSIEGRGEAGPLKGKQLPRLDCHMSQWYGWVSYFPQTSIYGEKSEITEASRH